MSDSTQLQTQPQITFGGLLHESQFPDGIIKPLMLAAGTEMAAGDTYFVNAQGIFQRLPAGLNGQVVTVVGGLPAYATPTPPLSSKVIVRTRDMTAVSGDVSYTGVGFKPTSLFAMGNVDAIAFGSSWGVSDSSKANELIEIGSTSNYAAVNGLFYINNGAGVVQSAIVKSYDPDGFTLSWTKTGSPTGTANLVFLCFR